MIHHHYFRILSLNFVVHFTSGQLQHAAKNKRWQSINCINYLDNKTTYINYPRIEIIDFESINLVHGIFTHITFLVIIFTRANSIFLYLDECKFLENAKTNNIVLFDLASFLFYAKDVSQGLNAVQPCKNAFEGNRGLLNFWVDVQSS